MPLSFTKLDFGRAALVGLFVLVAVKTLGEVRCMESEKKDSGKMKVRQVTIRTVDGSVLQGSVNLGARDRVSDLFTKNEEHFLVLFDAAYSGGTGKVLIVNKAHMVWIEPEDG